jgi:hypothetical protein
MDDGGANELRIAEYAETLFVARRLAFTGLLTRHAEGMRHNGMRYIQAMDKIVW